MGVIKELLPLTRMEKHVCVHVCKEWTLAAMGVSCSNLLSGKNTLREGG